MNLIVIVLDSFRQDHVSTYHKGTPTFEGIPPCQTPNIDQFAEECVVFENALPGSLTHNPNPHPTDDGTTDASLSPLAAINPGRCGNRADLERRGIRFWTHFGYLSLPRTED